MKKDPKPKFRVGQFVIDLEGEKDVAHRVIWRQLTEAKDPGWWYCVGEDATIGPERIFRALKVRERGT
jgi:hypothetical protein